MHVHLPKPLHGWREFLGEVGIIVIGVLIALGAEQVVEAAHWHARVTEAEASMRKELGEDNAVQAVARRDISPCIDRMLATVRQALIAERDTHRPFVAPSVAAPPFRTWDSDAWRAANASGVTSHMATDRMYDWSSPYALTADMDTGAVREYADWAPLLALDGVPPHPSETQRDRLLAAVAAARRDNQFLTWMAGMLLRYSGMVGVEPPAALARNATRAQASQLPGCRPTP